MTHVEVESSKEPIRLFKSDFLEFFTHIHPAVVAIIWAPVTVYFTYRAIASRPGGVSPIYIPIALVLGLVLWTLAEYSLHRFVFHFRPRSARQERVSFLFHGVHHAQPMSKTRLVMPPVVSIPLALLFYGLFYLLWSVILRVPHWTAPTFAGFTAGYLAYDMLHYSMHHFKMRGRALQAIRRHHMAHHARTPNLRFGVSTPLWDWVFGTEPT